MDHEHVNDRVNRVRDKLLAKKGVKPSGETKSKKRLKREQRQQQR